MKSCLSCIGLSLLPLNAQELKLKPEGPDTELSWNRAFPPSSGVPSQIQSRIFGSSDLKNWVEDTSLTLDDSSGNGISTVSLASPDAARFYRLEQFLSYLHRGDEGAPPAVYGQQLLNAKQGLAGLTLQKFFTPPEDPSCLPQIGWDPSTANYFDDYNTSPDDYNATLVPGDPERRYTDFRLNEAELAKFQQNGFVVAPRVNLIVGPEPIGEHPTPVDFYYKIWTDDLPVFITADSVLDAWHETFLGMLEEIEELVLYPKVRTLVFNLANLSVIENEWADEVTPGADHVRQAIMDLNLYLGTARSLLAGFDDSTPSSDLSLPIHWYQAAKAHTDTQKIGLYGDNFRIEDMTLFTPRGHYTNSQVLTAYFQGFLWLSRAQFQITLSNHTPQMDRELRAAILLALHVRDQGLLADWQEIENFVRSLNGQSDAMTVVEMIALLESLNLDNVDAIASDTDLATIRNALLASSYGVQEINGGQSETSCNPITNELPRVLSLIGQRWTPDAWTFNQVVFPEVKEDGVSSFRRLPSGLDAAYAVFGNDTALPILAERMADTNGVPFRDGYPYHQNLASARSVFDSQQEEFWTEHTYGSWLHCLRALSPPVSASAPDTFRTTAWKRRILNTQLASWSQLRHDTLLYAEQSFTPGVICEFPDGYVDPYPQLWNRLSNMALQYKDLLSTLNYPAGEFRVEARALWNEPTISLRDWNPFQGYSLNEFQIDEIIIVDRSTRLAAMCDHLENFSVQCSQLQAIAEQQLAGLEHTTAMKGFIKHTVENYSILGCNSERTYTGWFPNLYFMPIFSAPEDHPSALWNPVVADVHTDAADPLCSGDPGAILHVGTGKAQFMLIAVKHPDGTSCAYGGPVMSHYEFLTARDVRLNDDQWLQKLSAGEEPEFETWKHDFLVPE
ncbi:MAG: DUF3160 domain-containing protein [Akkermansiaceae bacterium]